MGTFGLGLKSSDKVTQGLHIRTGFGLVSKGRSFAKYNAMRMRVDDRLQF